MKARERKCLCIIKQTKVRERVVLSLKGTDVVPITMKENQQIQLEKTIETIEGHDVVVP